MSNLSRALLSVVFAASLAPGLCLGEQIEVVSNQYIVQRRAPSGVSAQKVNDLSYLVHDSAETFDVVIPKSAGVQTLGSNPRKAPIDWVKVAADCKEIKRDASVVSCEPNVLMNFFVVPNDGLFSLQWGLFDESDNDADIRATIAWNKGTGTNSTLIGVIDSGIYWAHPDLTGNLWANPGEVNDGVDNDGNGYVDDFFGVNTHFGTSDPNDCLGHGTHVSGIIGASGNNATGVSGVNWTTSLIVVNASNGNCNKTISTAASLKGYEYFYRLKRLGHNIRVVNASFGGTVFSQAAYDAISLLNSVDILLVAAAGNQTKNNDIVPYYPANYDLPNVISVGATGPTLRRPVYSNYGQSVDIAAPGGDVNYISDGIVSTWSPISVEGVHYKGDVGTSMAAPMVTGAIGLLASQRPYLTGTHLKNILYQSADNISALNAFVAGGRFLNLGAMSLAADPVDNCPANSNKLEPGICGCGIADSYIDSDKDTTYDCVDQCPVDAAKTAPGVCGCGVTDVDSDNDTTYDCVDQCPADAAKTAPGACGCGVPDVDGNANGVLDCRDPAVLNVVPRSPVLKAGKKYVTITMTPMAGVRYYVLKITVQPKGRGKAKTNLYISTTRVGTLARLATGSTVSVSYAYMVEGTPRTFSNYSGVKKAKIK